MHPISNSHLIKPVQTDMIQNLSEVKKINTFFIQHLNELPTRATVLSEQKAKPSTFTKNFASLIKSDIHSAQELKPQSSITAPFIFLEKLGASIIGKFKAALNSLQNQDNDSKLGVEKLVEQAKKVSKKTKTIH